MKGHTIDECRSLKDKIQNLIDNKIIIAKEPAPNVRNNPLPDNKGGDIHMIEIEDDWDPEGSIGLIVEGDEPKKPAVTLSPIVVLIQPSKGNVVNVSVPLEFEAPSAKAPKPIEVEFGIPKAPPPVEVTVLPPKVPIPVSMTDVTPFKTNAIPWDYTAEARRKGKTYTGEAIAAQGMTRTGRVYTPEHLAESSKQASGRVVETRPDDLWRKVQAKEYSVAEQLNETPAQISIMALLQSSEAHKNALMKILSEAYVLSNITGGEMANMVGKVLESHKITFHEDELPPEGLGHNKAMHITAQCKDHFITRILVDGGSSLNICPLITLRTLGKGLHEVKDGAISVKAFDGSQRSTIGEIILCLQMGPTWFDVEFQVIDVPEVIIHGDGSNPIYSRQTIPMIGGRRRIGGETYHHIERVNAVDKDKLWDSKIESILNWSGYEPGKGLGKNLQGITKPIKLKKHGTTFRLGYEYTWEEFNHWSPPWRGPYYPLEHPIPQLEQTFQPSDTLYGSEEDDALAAIKNLFLEDDMDCCIIFEEEGEEGHSIQAVNRDERLTNCVTLTYLDDEATTVTCNEAIQQTNIDSEEDDILEEVVREVENFENRPKPNLDETEVVNLGDTKNVKETRISAHLSPSEKKEYIEFLKEYEDIFALSYDDMTGLSTSIVAHKLPTDPTCPPVKQKLKKFKPDMSLKIKEEVTKQFKARVLMVVKYPTWLANIVPVPKKDGKIWMDEEDAVNGVYHAMGDKDAATKWTDECQKAFDRIKEYLSTLPVLVPPEPGRPPLLYLAMLDGAFGCVLGKHDETGRKEQAIYYLSKVNIHDQPAYCAHVEEEAEGKPWFYDIKEYLTTGENPELDNATEKCTLRRLSNNFFYNGGILYRRTPDLGLQSMFESAIAVRYMQM
ncbi:uncharacterized protein [Nicotiana sylvestris]|uniref:uncharacterized protein n=1 Tax=Nicotiana sylvestris TaxID=4096 RepID=UPI00388CB922